ncbi:MAG: hypothetical protein KME16_24980 [Scytolyngbya sp. HA4215-MV1]|jgi:hypothetical protein|nr:hypothetical protein [Scytolyngbya sp. HA4215-MV1]
MDQSRQQERHAAARAFMESLDQLQITLEPHESQREQTGRSTARRATHGPSRDRDKLPGASKSSGVDVEAEFDTALFEQAIADIEQFLHAKNQPED